MKSKVSAPDSPSHLSDRSKTLWRQLVPSRALSPGRLALLEEALSALDRSDEARGIIAREGMAKVTERTGMVHLNPVVKVERESRQLFVKIMDSLGLGWDGEIDGRRQ